MVSNDEIKKRLNEKRKGINSSKEEDKNDKISNKKQSNTANQIGSWWSARGTNEKAVIGIISCILGVILIAGIFGVASSDKDLADIQLSNAIYDGSGDYHLDIDNATTEVVINGSSEAGTEINATSSELNINDQNVKLNSNNEFSYKVKIPKDVDNVTIEFDASKPGKEDSYVELTIQRPSADDSLSSESTTTTSTPTWTEDDAINKVKNYGKDLKVGWSIQDAIDSSLDLAEESGTTEVRDGWSAISLSGSTYDVTYNYREDTYGGYDLTTKTIDFEVDMDTGEITPMNSMAQTTMDIVEGK